MNKALRQCLLLGLLLVAVGAGAAQAQIPIKIPGLPNFSPGGGGGSDIDVGKVIDSGGKLMKGALGVNRSEENVLGQSMALDIIKRYGLSTDAASTRRVVLIGRSLSKYVARAGLTYRFGLINSSSPNGFSAPGGYVFITTGMLRLLKTDEQLAAVLAHEIGHVLRRHALRSIAKANMTSGLLGLGSSAVGAAGGPNIAAFDNAVDTGIRNLLQSGYSRSDEYDADATGKKILADAGYNPDLMAQTLAYVDAAMPGKGHVDYHPETKDRIARLRK